MVNKSADRVASTTTCSNSLQGTISMSIYTQRVLPYVYRCTHKVTGQFYIGYREVNKLPSSLDLPQYRTSSKIVNPTFDEFEWLILAEFYSGDHAYDFEQELIHESWGDPLLLNKSCTHNCKKRFKGGRRQYYPLSDETKQKISNANKGHKHSDEARSKISLAGSNRKHSPESILKMKARIVSEETKKKISLAQTGVPKRKRQV